MINVLKKINVLFCISLFSSNVIANQYFIRIEVNSPKFIKEEIVIPSEPSFVDENVYPFSLFTKNFNNYYPEYSNGYSRYVWSKYGYFTFSPDKNYSKIEFVIPTENGTQGNPRTDISLYKNEELIYNCKNPNNGDYALYYCNFSVTNVKIGDILKFTGGSDSNGFLIFGSYNNSTTSKATISFY